MEHIEAVIEILTKAFLYQVPCELKPEQCKVLIDNINKPDCDDDNCDYSLGAFRRDFAVLKTIIPELNERITKLEADVKEQDADIKQLRRSVNVLLDERNEKNRPLGWWA